MFFLEVCDAAHEWYENIRRQIDSFLKARCSFFLFSFQPSRRKMRESRFDLLTGMFFSPMRAGSALVDTFGMFYIFILKYYLFVNSSIITMNLMHLPASNQIREPVVLHRQDFCTFSSAINHHWLCIQLMNISLWHIPSFLLRHYLSHVHLFQLSTTQIRLISHILNTQGVNQAFILNSGLQAIRMSMFVPAAPTVWPAEKGCFLAICNHMFAAMSHC